MIEEIKAAAKDGDSLGGEKISGLYRLLGGDSRCGIVEQLQPVMDLAAHGDELALLAFAFEAPVHVR